MALRIVAQIHKAVRAASLTLSFRVVTTKNMIQQNRRQSNRAEQWQVNFGDTYKVCGQTATRLPAGGYSCQGDCQGNPVLKKQTMEVDQLIRLPDSLSDSVLDEVARFWSLGDRYSSLGFLHRRGYLFHGAQGTGKSCIIHQIVADIIRAGNITLFCEHPHWFLQCAKQFRRIEPDRPIVCVFEDIDAIIEQHGDSQLLQWLDGNCQVANAINLASTNYLDRLEPRIVSRPRRFDRVYEIGPPNAAQRTAYLEYKLGKLAMGEMKGDELTEVDIQQWVERTQGMSLAGVAELIISVFCLGLELDVAASHFEKLPDSSLDHAPISAN